MRVAYTWEDNPHLFLPITGLAVLFIAFFLVAFCAMALAMIRIKREISPDLPWVLGAELSNALFASADYARYRFWIGVGFAGAFASMAAIILVSALFGTPAK